MFPVAYLSELYVCSLRTGQGLRVYIASPLSEAAPRQHVSLGIPFHLDPVSNIDVDLFLVEDALRIECTIIVAVLLHRLQLGCHHP